MSRPAALLRLGGYALAAVALAFEATVGWLMLHPDPAEEYRVFYLDQTTTCLAQPVAGTYVLDKPVSFLPDGEAAAGVIKVCGWQAPTAMGTASVGNNSRLRFVFPPAARPTVLQLRAVGVRQDGTPERQRVDIVVNGEVVSHLGIRTTSPASFRVPLPADLVAASNGQLEVELRYPQAIRLHPLDSDTNKRAIRMLSVVLGE